MQQNNQDALINEEAAKQELERFELLKLREESRRQKLREKVLSEGELKELVAEQVKDEKQIKEELKKQKSQLNEMKMARD